MRKILSLSMMILLTSVSFAQVIISGNIKNAPKDLEIQVSYYNNPIELESVYSSIAKLDRNGNVKITVELKTATSAQLMLGENSVDIYIVPMSDIHFSVDYNDIYKTIKFTGKNAADNNYLAKEHLEGFYYKSVAYSQFDDEYEFKLFVDSLEAHNKQFLNQYGVHRLSREFKKHITNTIAYQFINTRWMDRIGYDSVTHKLDFYKPVSENFFDFLKSMNLNDQGAYDNDRYHLALTRYLYEFHDKRNEIPKGLNEQEQIRFKIKTQYYIRKSLFNSKVLDYQLTYFLKVNLMELVNDPVLAKDLLIDYQKSCENQEYIDIIQKLYTYNQKFSAGKLASEFSLLDSNGGMVSLSSLKGRVVFIDFWATWCKPCLSSMPNTLRLIDKFKDNSNVVFLLINVDDRIESWKNYLSQNTLLGVNLFATKEQSSYLRKAFNFNGIPRYLLINKDGTFIDADSGNGAKVEEQISTAVK